MRIAFIIVCMAAIGVTMVHLRNEQNVLRNRMLSLQTYYQLELPREVMAQQLELAQLTAPVKVQTRAQEMALNLVDKDLKTRLARNETPENPDPRRPTVAPTRSGGAINGRPDFGGGRD